MSDKNARSIPELMEAIRVKLKNRSVQLHPTSEMVIKAITRRPNWIEEPEASTAEDWDAEVFHAACDLLCKPQRFYSHPNDPTRLERPEDRLRRIGNRDGKKSPFYQELLEATDGGKDLPRTTDRTFKTMQKRFDIANTYRDFLAKHPSLNYTEAKKEARAYIQTTMQPSSSEATISDATIDDALRDFDMDWPAYSVASPRKGRRKT